MTVALSDPLQRRWESYLATESRGTREAKLRTLNKFVEELRQLPEAAWKRWALDLAARIVEDGADIPVRRPLFERVLFPALVEALDAQSPGSARRLAGLSQHLYRCPACMERLGPARSSEWALLQAAVTQDPADSRSRQRLIHVIANHLRYTLHELPAGVLSGTDGATVEQCDELLVELNKFRSLVAADGRTADYAPLVTECDHHFSSYKQYLLERPKHESYSGFLEARGGSPAGDDHRTATAPGRAKGTGAFAIVAPAVAS
jgi:hypothetical protein